MGSSMDLWRILQVCTHLQLKSPDHQIPIYPSELAEPQKLLPYFLKPSIVNLDPDTISVHLQAAVKAFGVWSVELSQAWDDDNIPRVKAVVDETVEGLKPFASNADIEVQERVCPYI